MTLRRTVPAGLLDAAMASLATFAIGLYAARFLDAEVLGVYAIFITAFLAAAAFPRQFVFVPAEVVAVEEPAAQRLGLLSSTLKIGIGPAVVAAAVAVVAAAAVSGTGWASEARWLYVFVGVGLLLSPVQDHVRRLFHLAGQSWIAALLSVVQVIVAAAVLGYFLAGGVAEIWVPFAALFGANAISLGLGLTVAMRHRVVEARRLRLRQLSKMGAKLSFVGLLPSVVGFVAASMLLAFTDPETVGYAEAGRIVGRPILVVATGLFAAMRPRSMEAAAAGDRPAARSVSRLFMWIMLSVGGLFATVFGPDWDGNLFARLIPAAYVIGGLAAASIVAQAAEGLTRPLDTELATGRYEDSLVRIEIVGNVVRLAIAAAAGVIGAFALPLGVLALALVKYVGYHRALRRMYAVTREHAVVRA